MYPILTQQNQLKANKVRSINTIYTINLQAKKKIIRKQNSKNYHKTHNVQLQSNLELCQRLISIFYSEFHCPNRFGLFKSTSPTLI